MYIKRIFIANLFILKFNPFFLRYFFFRNVIFACYLRTMIKKIFLFFFSLLLISSCVKKRDLSTNTVVAHILSQPDGLHPYNNNSVMRSYIFSYTQKTLLSIRFRIS